MRRHETKFALTSKEEPQKKMPNYAYKCTNCGFEKDYLQKMSDKPITKCPKCGQDTMKKELSAPGFELKGTGWAATDFNGGPKAVPAAHVHGDK